MPLSFRDAVSAVAAPQRAFVEALMQPDAPVPPDILGSSAAQRVKRFNVYRNNVHASLAAALAARFPVVERLVGDEFFRAMALAFIERHPPTSPVLSQYGETLARFIENFEPARSLLYLADVARLEWARSFAYHAEDREIQAVSALANLTADVLGGVRLKLHPAFAAIRSPFPIVSIWWTNTHDDVVAAIGPDHGAECALVTRPHLDVLVTRVPDASVAFIEALQDGRTLGEATGAAANASTDFNLAATLSLLFASGSVSEIELSPKPTNHGTTA